MGKSKEVQHSPRPWRIKPTPVGSMGRHWVEIVDSAGKAVVRADGIERTRNGETEFDCGVVISDGDARIIEAGPDLLEYARLEEEWAELSDRANRLVAGPSHSHGEAQALYLQMDEIKDKASAIRRAAIAKAEGRA